VTSFPGPDTSPVSSCHQIDIIQAFYCDSSFATEMKNKRVPEIDRRANFRAPSEKPDLTKHLVGFWRDLEDNQHWKYEELSPVQLLETSKLDERPTDKDELARAEFLWRRRPRLLPAAGFIVWIIVALGLPFWLFIVPAKAVPLLIISAVVINTGIERSVRWRCQYELSIDRLSRHFGRSAHSTPSV
jgi:hypothetical protein